jgi:oligopeptide transport system ATP-binding protein
MLESGVNANPGNASGSEPLLKVSNVRKYFPIASRIPLAPTRGDIRAVDGVSLQLKQGQTLCIVGESGCGKSTLGRLVLGLERLTAGEITLNGQLLPLASKRSREMRVEAVLQDPWSSLNPRRRLQKIIGEPLVVAGYSRSQVDARVQELLEFVGLDPATRRNFPHEFSGGQRQRIAIARALATKPRVIVLDEPVSALDVSIRAQIINLLRDIQQDLGSAYLMIAHDLATVRYLSHRVAVMYLGVIMEEGPSQTVFSEPLHPYTQALLSASLPLRPGVGTKRIRLGGEVPSPSNPPSGCRFRTRCPRAFSRCAEEVPVERVYDGDHRVSCHLFE